MKKIKPTTHILILIHFDNFSTLILHFSLLSEIFSYWCGLFRLPSSLSPQAFISCAYYCKIILCFCPGMLLLALLTTSSFKIQLSLCSAHGFSDWLRWEMVTFPLAYHDSVNTAVTSCPAVWWNSCLHCSFST